MMIDTNSLSFLFSLTFNELMIILFCGISILWIGMFAFVIGNDTYQKKRSIEKLIQNSCYTREEIFDNITRILFELDMCKKYNCYAFQREFNKWLSIKEYLKRHKF